MLKIKFNLFGNDNLSKYKKLLQINKKKDIFVTNQHKYPTTQKKKNMGKIIQ